MLTGSLAKPDLVLLSLCDSLMSVKEGSLHTEYKGLANTYLGILFMAQMVKASACNAGDPASIPGLGRSPGEGNGNPLLYPCLENPMDGQRSLVYYSPWGRQESDMDTTK